MHHEAKEVNYSQGQVSQTSPEQLQLSERPHLAREHLALQERPVTAPLARQAWREVLQPANGHANILCLPHASPQAKEEHKGKNRGGRTDQTRRSIDFAGAQRHDPRGGPPQHRPSWPTSLGLSLAKQLNLLGKALWDERGQESALGGSQAEDAVKHPSLSDSWVSGPGRKVEKDWNDRKETRGRSNTPQSGPDEDEPAH